MIDGALDREKLAKTLGMLGSAHDGEIAAAGRAAEAMVRNAGLTWRDVVFPPLPNPRPQPPDEMSFSATIMFLVVNQAALTAWEQDFVRSVRAQKYPPTQKQREVLNRIVEKVRRGTARAA
jgi:hypothetical protein